MTSSLPPFATTSSSSSSSAPSHNTINASSPSPFVHDIRLEKVSEEEFVVTYSRPLVRFAATVTAALTLIFALSAYLESGTSVVRLSCARHPIESNASYHLHEDSDCFLEIEEDMKHTASTFELSSVRVVSVLVGTGGDGGAASPAFSSSLDDAGDDPAASSPLNIPQRRQESSSYEIWLDGPKHLNHLPQERHLWLRGLQREEALGHERSIVSFLNETRSGNAGLISLEIITRNDRLRFYVSVYFLAVALALDLFLLYFVPYAESTALKDFQLKQELVNAFGCALSTPPAPRNSSASPFSRGSSSSSSSSSSRVWPLHLVAGCAADAVVIRDVAPSGRLSFKPRARQEFALFVVLGETGEEMGSQEREPLSAGSESNPTAGNNKQFRLPMLMGSSFKRRAQLDTVVVQFNAFLAALLARRGAEGLVPGGHSRRAPSMCVVCFDRPLNTTLLPCRHTCVCQTCAGNLVKCPMCREIVKEKMKIFM